MNEKKLHFVVKMMNPMNDMDQFHPNGQFVVNRTEWRGKEPRSCVVTGVKVRPYTAKDSPPHLADVEVTYRPNGCITYTGDTRYDGWTCTPLDRATDGTLLDGAGQPLPPGKPAVFHIGIARTASAGMEGCAMLKMLRKAKREITAVSVT
ncbi:MAG TPA: hypothetical protein VG269_03815 [Tepidisphaeraceae bacterium]|jgi:hypothetical protein|nr:hypothetical protein [Tepidisphaeraceae bacterium]